MDVIQINVQITKNPRQYEAVRLGMEATVNRNETAEDAIKEATRRLNELYNEMYMQKTKDGAEDKKTQAKPAPVHAPVPVPAPASAPASASAPEPAPAQAQAPSELAAAAAKVAKEVAAVKEIIASIEEAAPEQEGENDERELLKFDDKRLPKIIARIEKAKDDKGRKEVLKNVVKYYKLDEGAAKAIALAVKINQ